MAKFKVGDRLRVNKDTDVFHEGDIVTVAYVDTMWAVEDEGEANYQMSDGWGVFESDLDSAEPTLESKIRGAIWWLRNSWGGDYVDPNMIADELEEILNG
jgi:hypothetical protein